MLAIGAAMLGGAVPGDRLMNADLRDTGLPDASAAIVLCARTLCHLPDPDTGFAELSRITERGGSLIISDLHPTFRVPVTRLPTPTGKIEVPTFRRTPEALVDCARQFGFACAERFDFAPGDGDAFFVLRLAHEG
jgi:ubiquinone/menaquinone biosynthesis C-methylase UbiE